MIIKLIGIKKNIFNLFDQENKLIPITIIKLYPNVILNILKQKLNTIIKIGAFPIEKKKYIKKSNLGYNFNLKKQQLFNNYFEFKTKLNISYKIGQILDLNLLQFIKKINIISISKGKGYCGNIKKNKFNRGPMSHGSKHHRLQGSLGAGTSPGRVFPGKKMSGKDGNKKVTIKNLTIFYLNISKNILLLKGSIPGNLKQMIFLSFIN